MDLLALADFTLVARHEGFGKAARASHRPKATLSRRVAELEAALDVRLFERGARTLKLTEEGRALFARTGPLLAELEETAVAIGSGGETPRGRLRISAPLLFSQTAMGRLAAEFIHRHPDVRLEVTTDDRMVDMIEEGYDLVIRVNPAPDDTLVGRPFLHDRLVVVAGPGMVRLAAGIMPAVVRGNDPERSWTVDTPDGPIEIAVNPVLRLSSLIMIRDAVRTGVGVAKLPLSLVSEDIDCGRLVPWGNVAKSEIALWALYPTRRLLNARVSAFLEFLRNSFPRAAPEELAAYLKR
ncbi:LysR family transcriptional regulator [Sphingomonas sp. Leaf208]|jgi:DNA-binding transcriptional LysR family regulator|uniref:LysR family transcriptional regulator n=1 Tax=Sphingomonas sp. Leaf208 TaxID=1735679 RepID=UPI000700927B|nr:LysR family transcriptional regulator [Sphingomonas sp. Leaf208]KQM48151.1 LysR family transcriptional regulator [Sphingomonas sp. Leaf208]